MCYPSSPFLHIRQGHPASTTLQSHALHRYQRKSDPSVHQRAITPFNIRLNTGSPFLAPNVPSRALLLYRQASENKTWRGPPTRGDRASSVTTLHTTRPCCKAAREIASPTSSNYLGGFALTLHDRSSTEGGARRPCMPCFFPQCRASIYYPSDLSDPLGAPLAEEEGAAEHHVLAVVLCARREECRVKRKEQTRGKQIRSKKCGHRAAVEHTE